MVWIKRIRPADHLTQPNEVLRLVQVESSNACRFGLADFCETDVRCVVRVEEMNR